MRDYGERKVQKSYHFARIADIRKVVLWRYSFHLETFENL
jgi:hypothetical protein